MMRALAIWRKGIVPLTTIFPIDPTRASSFAMIRCFDGLKYGSCRNCPPKRVVTSESSNRVQLQRTPGRICHDCRIRPSSRLALLRWLNLDDSETLELECRKDIDTVGNYIRASVSQKTRLFEQVKRHQANITLRSPISLEALA